jgi:hypothetical protein
VPYAEKPVCVPAVLPPTSMRFILTAGVSASIAHGSPLPPGRARSASAAQLVVIFVACVSTTGEAPVTVTASSRPAMFIEMFSVAVKPAPTCAVRFTVVNPGSSNVTS